MSDVAQLPTPTIATRTEPIGLSLTSLGIRGDGAPVSCAVCCVLVVVVLVHGGRRAGCGPLGLDELGEPPHLPLDGLHAVALELRGVAVHLLLRPLELALHPLETLLQPGPTALEDPQ